MKVTVTLTIGEKETRLVGKAPAFGNGVDYKKGFDSRLRNLGFWLSDWHYEGHGGPAHRSKVFIPWTSCLMVETPEE